MPKRKSDDDYDKMQRKIRRLEEKYRRKRRHRSRSRHRRHTRPHRRDRDRYTSRYRSENSDSYEYSSDRSSRSRSDDQTMQGRQEERGYDIFFNEDDLIGSPQTEEDQIISDPIPSTSSAEPTGQIQSVVVPVSELSDPQPPPSQPTPPAGEQPAVASSSKEETAAPVTENLDIEVLEILGVDPTNEKKYGKEIHKDLSVRFQHWTTTGLNKELRKEFKEKYLTPENCKLIDPPELNPEIKAAVSEIVLKRDKAIEGKQKELSLAITCLGEAITILLSSKEKNSDLLKLLIDSARMICDCQHADTVTRRNFFLSSVKKEVREQLQNTKVDTLLFGENLAETLKSAKAINKSGTDLKQPQAAKLPNKNSRQQNPSSYSQRNLNWRASGPGRKPTTTGPPRTREQAAAPTRGRLTGFSRQSQRPPPRQSYNRR